MNDLPAEDGLVRLCAIDQGPWQAVQGHLRHALEAHQLIPLTAPITLILHDLIDSAVKILHRHVFRGIIAADLGLSVDNDNEELDVLFRSELSEHGSLNIAQACANADLLLSVSFPAPVSGRPGTLAQIDMPIAWSGQACNSERLIDALGLEMKIENVGNGSRITLTKRMDHQAVMTAANLLSMQEELTCLGEIFEQLGYGLIRFSSVGEIIAVSPSMLARLQLADQQVSLATLTETIPLSFHNDITWGLALGEGNGAFENYRIRVRPPGTNGLSILFNVSGFRQPDGTINSLWQAVSQDAGGAQLSEGSILSEVRIHNITRHYVPQLVEQKARHAVRLGKTSLTNEERWVAVLFCDIVGFTSYVERHAGSESIIDTLNSILRRVSLSVKRNNGSIDKFMGDCIMALFDDPADAVLAAIDMQSHAQDINSLRDRAGQQVLTLRIGIHWGEVIIGNVGTAERLDWTAIGDVVNTASRIEKSCQPGFILISQAVREAVEAAHPGRFEFGDVFGIQVKGKEEELAVCRASLAHANHHPAAGK